MSGFPGLVFFEDAGKVLVRVEAAAERPPLVADRLHELLVEAGYGDCLPNDAALTALLVRCNAQESGFELQVGERRDGAFELTVDDDAMHAWVTLAAARGGRPVASENVFMALGEAGLLYGIDEAAVRAACAANGDIRFCAARGLPAEDGENARFELLVDDTRDRVPRMNESGLIDFRELGAIPVVEAGQPLMRRVPPTRGVDGYNVRGELVPAQPGRAEPFVDGLIGAAVAPDDPNLLVALVNGQPVRCGNGVSVEQVVRFGNVNLASGNISFDGTVHVEGEIAPGMKVHATGDIIVSGVVDGADLDAGGDIQIGGGVIAQAKVRAAGSVSARFAENAQIYAGSTISIGDMALQCDLQAINSIVVGSNSPQRGRLAGGSARAMMLVSAPVYGLATGGVTSVLVGVNPVLEAQYQEVLQRIEKLRGEEDSLQKLVQHLTKAGDKGGMLERAKISWQRAVQSWAQLLPEKDELEKQLAFIQGAKITVGVGVSGAVDVAFGKKSLRLRRACDAGEFVLRDGRIVFVDPSGEAQELG